MESRAGVSDITFGTGYKIFHQTILPALEQAEHEIILVTCFWAASSTRDALGESLLTLGRKAERSGHRIRVRIGFSSTSLLQKLTQCGPRRYAPSTWHSVLGLPAELQSAAGLDLEITSMFYLPFSVWHPKFVIIDRCVSFLPSCNVSWEAWFEVCVRLTGPVVGCFLRFWETYWVEQSGSDITTSMLADYGADDAESAIKCLFLPSPHSRNPQFRLLPWQKPAAPPRTPLNMHLLDLLDSARHDVRLQTPNITSSPVLSALMGVLERGVDLKIVTSERLMILEQLVTAGTTTDRCMRRFIAAYSRQRSSVARKHQHDQERGLLPLGRLQISYYQPREALRSYEGGSMMMSGTGDDDVEPIQSHAKLTIVDESVVVFGSGNMDRASWYTSQELGVAIHSEQVARLVLSKLEAEMEGRTHFVFDSANME